MNKPTKNQYIRGFVITVVVLALGRCAYQRVVTAALSPLEDPQTVADTAVETPSGERMWEDTPHRIKGVSSYRESFPDSNNVQLEAARRWGVSPVRNRADAEQRKKELVYVGVSPYYHVDPLYSSIPYLVPRAAILLHDIGRAFYDSLYVKGMPMSQFIVTSVLRSEDDVAKLRRRNGNATENSCHLYGTTFDISYTRYQPLTRPVRDDSLKFVLCEVLRDLREQERCYVKYEVKQSCFHLTVR